MSQKIKKKKIVYSILIIIRRWNDVETKRFHEIFLIIFNIFILLFIKLRVTFQQGKNKYGSILDPKKKKKRSYEKEIITRINWFDYFWDNWYTHSTEHLQFCNWYHSPMLQQPVFNRGPEGREEGSPLASPSPLTCAPTNLYESGVSRFTRCVTSSIVF